MVSPRENLRMVLNHEDPAWIPVLPLVEGYNLPAAVPGRLLHPRHDILGIIRWLSGDILNRCGGIRTVRSARICTRTEDADDTTITSTETPAGVLRMKSKRSTVPAPSRTEVSGDDLEPTGAINLAYITEHPVKEKADYAALQSLYAETRFELDAEKLAGEIKAIGDDGFAMLCGGSMPFMALIHTEVGLERLVEHLADYPEVVEKTLEVMTEAYLNWMRTAAASDAYAIMSSDDASTNLVSPALFKRYILPAYRQAADICHARGKVLIVHTCGCIRDLLTLFAESGIDAVECVCPPTTGNTPPGLARQAWGRKIVVIARIDPPVLVRGTPADVRRAVADMLAQVAPGDNFALTLPCGRAPVENLRAAVDTIRQLGKFPVQPAGSAEF